MRTLTLSRAILLVVSISSSLSAPGKQGCNYKDLEVTDVEITNMGPIMDQQKTYLEVGEVRGKKVTTGMMVFKKDVPNTAEIKWEMFSIDENNEATKKAEGKKTPFCSYLVNQKVLADMMVKHSNLSATCPYKKGTYKINDAAPDTKYIPCKAPGNSDIWECKIKLTEGPGRNVILELTQKYRLIR